VTKRDVKFRSFFQWAVNWDVGSEIELIKHWFIKSSQAKTLFGHGRSNKKKMGKLKKSHGLKKSVSRVKNVFFDVSRTFVSIHPLCVHTIKKYITYVGTYVHTYVEWFYLYISCNDTIGPITHWARYPLGQLSIQRVSILSVSFRPVIHSAVIHLARYPFSWLSI
jgi:hypothetical protein